MSYNPNFNNFPNNFTFHESYRPNLLAPPPPPGIVHYTQQPPISDQDILNVAESKIQINVPLKSKPKSASISQACAQLKNIVFLVNTLEEKQKYLENNVDKLSEIEWKQESDEIRRSKSLLNCSMSQINDTYLDHLKRALAKRLAKRSRLQRRRLELKNEKDVRKKQWDEKSRRIDENLQKFKDDIDKRKQEEESKAQADIILREVLRKKHDAKKYISKLDALVKLRGARQNTAKGRGVSVSESETSDFSSKIDKLKSLWVRKLSAYEKEENELRAKLKQDSEKQVTSANEIESKVVKNLGKWRQFLFGSRKAVPQTDFKGDIQQFVAVRTQWDSYISSDGSPVPVGWIMPFSKD